MSRLPAGHPCAIIHTIKYKEKTGLKKTKQEKRREKKSFRQAMDRELREHRSSFIVFYVLRALVIVVLVRQLMLGSYESAF